ncbi:MAG: putative metal-binding motif-containing protein, partial [Myxococcales bacterium]|nr:putative metal-binding motif-containing protein [Myxococcales bacterium]
GSFEVDRRLTLRGEGAGTTVLESDSDLLALVYVGGVVIEDLTLDGAGTGRVLRFHDTGSLDLNRLEITGGAPGTDLDGDYGVTLYLTDGVVTLADSWMTSPTETGWNDPWSPGSHLLAYDADVTLERVEVANGSGGQSGMIRVEYGSLSILESWIHDGFVRGDGVGAGASAWRADTLVVDSAFEAHGCEAGADCWGAALSVEEADLTVVSSYFGWVYEVRGGGQLYVAGDFTASGSFFEYGGTNSEQGGCVHHDYGDMDVTGSVFRECYTDSSLGGAMVFHSGQDVWMVGNAFCSNYAYWTGGAFYAYLDEGTPGTRRYANNLFLGNEAQYGSAMAFEAGAAESTGISNNHFVHNQATAVDEPATVAFWNSTNPSFDVRNNLFMGDTGSALYFGEPSGATSSYNAFFDNAGGPFVPGYGTGDGTGVFGDPQLMGGDADPCSPWPWLPGPGSLLVDAGDPAILDADSSRSDIGAFGGDAGGDFLSVDLDGDGASRAIDCDDADWMRSPYYSEEPYNGVDDDCDPSTPDDDLDGDGWDGWEDCDDGDPGRYPGAADPEDGVDQDCNGVDACVTEVVEAGEHALGSTCAMADAFWPSCSGPSTNGDAARSFVAPADGVYTFDTVGSDYDSTLELRSGCADYVPFACNDD